MFWALLGLATFCEAFKPFFASSNRVYIPLNNDEQSHPIYDFEEDTLTSPSGDLEQPQYNDVEYFEPDYYDFDTLTSPEDEEEKRAEAQALISTDDYSQTGHVYSEIDRKDSPAQNQVQNPANNLVAPLDELEAEGLLEPTQEFKRDLFYPPPPSDPQSSPSYGPPQPPPDDSYGPPQPPPNPSYGPPQPPPSSSYGPPQPPPSPSYGPPQPPPSPSYNPPTNYGIAAALPIAAFDVDDADLDAVDDYNRDDISLPSYNSNSDPVNDNSFSDNSFNGNSFSDDTFNEDFTPFIRDGRQFVVNENDNDGNIPLVNSFPSFSRPPQGVIHDINNAPLSPESTWNYSYETAEGTRAEAQGAPKLVTNPDDGGALTLVHVMRGSYSFVADDGVTYQVDWFADETGFHPTAPHLPRAPEPVRRTKRQPKATAPVKVDEPSAPVRQEKAFTPFRHYEVLTPVRRLISPKLPKQYGVRRILLN